MIAKMRHNGETCTAANRFYVEAPVAEAFAAKLADGHGRAADRPRPRGGNRLGPLVDADTATRWPSWSTAPSAAGAKATRRRRDARAAPASTTRPPSSPA